MALVFSLDAESALASLIAQGLGLDLSPVEIKNFPDGESYLRILQAVAGESVVLVGNLQSPNSKFLPLVFLAETLKDLGASKVGLIAPYLPYMRQDYRFHEGEGITSKYFAKLLSQTFSWLMTIDPHLHRYRSLSEIYTIPTYVLHGAPSIARWIRDHVPSPLLIGPDEESRQWVADVAQLAQAPYVVLEKIRYGDRTVKVSVPEVEKWKTHTPVLVDDIISTGHTMMETIGHLNRLGMAPPICVGVHGLFIGTAHEDLLRAGAREVVTTNTIFSKSSQIDVSSTLVSALGDFMHDPRNEGK